jgi:hypothetical protein
MNKRRQRLSAICSTSIKSEDIVMAEEKKEVPKEDVPAHSAEQKNSD